MALFPAPASLRLACLVKISTSQTLLPAPASSSFLSNQQHPTAPVDVEIITFHPTSSLQDLFYSLENSSEISFIYHPTKPKHPRNRSTDCIASPAPTSTLTQLSFSTLSLRPSSTTKMPATVVQNPPAQTESKSAKKKKAKAAAASGTDRTESPGPSATPEKPSSVVGNNEAGENVYIQLLKKYVDCSFVFSPYSYKLLN